MADLVAEFKAHQKVLIDLSEKKARVEGQRDIKLAELKKKYGVTTVAEAELKFAKMSEEIEQLETQLRTKIDELDSIIEKAEE